MNDLQSCDQSIRLFLVSEISPEMLIIDPTGAD